jgi:hypothetical protein
MGSLEIAEHFCSSKKALIIQRRMDYGGFSNIEIW